MSDYSSDCDNCKDAKYEVFISTKDISENLAAKLYKLGIGSSEFHANLLIEHYKNDEETILYIGENEFASEILRNLLFNGLKAVKIRKQ